MLLKMFKTLPVFLAALILLAGGCAHYHFRIVVQDAEDHAVPGGIVYVESYDQNGAVDFTWVKIGDSITVPPQGQPPFSLSGSNETNISIVVFAKGKKPLVMHDPTGVLNPELWEYMLEDAPLGNHVWDPKFDELQFPFVHQFNLHAKLIRKENAPLIEAFMEAYAPLKQQIISQQARPSEIEKYEFLRGKVYETLLEMKK